MKHVEKIVLCKGLDDINEMLDYVKYNLYLITHKGSGFDSYVVLNNLPQWRTVVSLNNNGAGIVCLKFFNGWVDPAKMITQYVQFRCRLLQVKFSVKRIGRSCKLQPFLFTQQFEHDEVYEDNWEEKENDWLAYLGNDVLSTAFSYATYSKIVKLWKN